MLTLRSMLERLLGSERAAGGRLDRTPFTGTVPVSVSARASRRAHGARRGGRLVLHKPRPLRDPAVAARMAEIRRRPVRR